MSTEVPARPSVPYDDPLDRLSNQAGSYDDARGWLGELPDTITLGPSWAEHEADKRVPKSAKLSPARRRQIARAAVGPQYGEDALPVADQTRPAEERATLRDQVEPVADQQFEERIQRERERAKQNGGRPDTAERLLRERRAKRQSEYK